jgi:hypothetical protein
MEDNEYKKMGEVCPQITLLSFISSQNSVRLSQSNAPCVRKPLTKKNTHLVNLDDKKLDGLKCKTHKNADLIKDLTQVHPTIVNKN